MLGPSNSAPSAGSPPRGDALCRDLQRTPISFSRSPESAALTMKILGGRGLQTRQGRALPRGPTGRTSAGQDDPGDEPTQDEEYEREQRVVLGQEVKQSAGSALTM
mmetsp:Transcript_36485/g.84173  ORF Transcript_36485/g.84173 Transcript_36485/m.84173 type:complete len:106 (+) Transcript_36485:56-373(+)